jgi:putative membrane protein
MALRRAEAAFLEEQVFRTRDRTGILVFLALYEHRAVILADQGIHRAVPSGLWQELVDELVAGVAAGEAARALERTVRRCGEVLVEHRVARQPDDRDELDDRPRIREH